MNRTEVYSEVVTVDTVARDCHHNLGEMRTELVRLNEEYMANVIGAEVFDESTEYAILLRDRAYYLRLVLARFK